MSDDILVTTREAAREAQVSGATIRRWASDGRLAPAGTRGRETLYDLADVFEAERKASLRRRWRETKAGRRVPTGRCIALMGGVDVCGQPAVAASPVQLCFDHVSACYSFVADVFEQHVTEVKRNVIRETENNPPPPSYVYFIGYSDRIKIGYSIAPKQRFETFHPDEVMLVLAGTRAHERALHELFKRHRIRGEWFRRDQEILDFIAERSGENEWDYDAGDLRCHV